MNDVTPEVNGQVQTEAAPRPRSPRLNAILVIAAAVVLIAGGVLLFNEVGLSTGCPGEGACMLYFYTDD